MDLSVIIPSKTESNLIACVSAVRKHEPRVRIIVVDDFPAGKRPRVAGVEWREGIHPFVFARNINLGIAGCDGDVVLLNDDALLETPGGFRMMQRFLEERSEYGLLAADYINRLQQPKLLIEAPKMVPFICVLIPRRTIDRLKELEKGVETYPGLLDERFVAYGYDDDDYCLRVKRVGMKIGTFAGCRVNHSKLKSTYRAVMNRPPGLKLAREIFCAKWGKKA